MTDPRSSPEIPVRGSGPRTDVRYLTQAQLLKSAWQFLVATIVMTVAWLAVGHFGLPTRLGHANPLVVGLLWLCFVLAVMGFAGSLYLAVRMITRSPSYARYGSSIVIVAILLWGAMGLHQRFWVADRLGWGLATLEAQISEKRQAAELHDATEARLYWVAHVGLGLLLPVTLIGAAALIAIRLWTSRPGVHPGAARE